MKKAKKLFKKTEIRKFGHWVFIIGIAATLYFTLLDPSKLQYQHGLILLVLGLIVGLIDVPKKEANAFLIAVIAWILISGVKFEQITYQNIGPYLKAFFLNAAMFLSPAAAIVALRIVYRIYKESK